MISSGLGQKIISVAVTLAAVVVLSFAVVRALPGDPAHTMLGERATPEAIAQLRTELGLDQSVFIQFGVYLKDLSQLQLGTSIKSQRPITQEIAERLPATVELTLLSLAIATFFGSVFGVLAAVFRNTAWDTITMLGALAGVSMPIYWLALMALWVLSTHWSFFPVSGRIDALTELTPITGMYLVDALLHRDLRVFGESLWHITLPACVLATIPMSVITRFMRSSMLEVLSQDYVRTARAKGLSGIAIILKHALKNALIPVITIVGLQFGTLLGGAIITEHIFSWPGMGSWLLESVLSRDIPAIQSAILIVGILFIVINLMTDLSYRWIDPRLSQKMRT